ncbi:MAG TPA: hypothetical protein VMT76_15290 [Puia sp.]|nr:hypothetical protein [Puia sp.]
MLTRKSEWMNRLRSYKVIIDGQEAGFIKNDSSEEFIVEPGYRKVQCKLNWLSSPEFDVTLKQNEIVYLAVKSSARFYMPLTALFVAGLAFTYFYKQNTGLRPVWLWWLQIITLAPYFLYALYYVTIGRKEYFKVEEDMDNVFSK